METATRSRKISVPQSEFLASNSLFRGFVGGRSAGKSWVGSFDLLMRAKRGHTYLIASPTSTLMHDTTFPTFKELAQEMGIWGPCWWEDMPEVVLTPSGQSEVKLTPYPTVRLTTGATIRFRTAEDPEKLRGPNLSGVWLDEASLMSIEAFNVAIACLREKGKQGWLSATYTPKGLGHWTFEVFNTGRPNTFQVHSDTSENSFNPPEFRATLAVQYSPQRQRQELGGEYVSLEGAEWPPDYFPSSIWQPVERWPAHWRTSALALDPAMGEGEHGKKPPTNRPPKPGCYAAFTFVGVASDNSLWVDAWMSQSWDASMLIEMGFRLVKETGAQAFAVEVNGGQAFLAELYQKEARQRGTMLPLYAINNIEDKEVRIRQTLTPFLAQGRLRFREGSPGAKLLVNQARDFPVGEYKDGIDSLQMGVIMCDYLLGKRPGGAQPRALR